MQINKVSVNNFRGIEALEIIPKKMNVFVGKNGTGKSSSLAALRYVLTGNAPEGLLRNGAENGFVSCDLYGHTIKRAFGLKTTVYVDDKPTTKKNLEKFVEEQTKVDLSTVDLAVSDGLLEAITNGTVGQRLVSVGLIPMKMDLDQLFTFFPSLSEIEKRVLKHYFPATPETFGLEKIDSAYAEIFLSRKEAKKQLEEETVKAKVEEGKRTLPIVNAEIAKMTERQKSAAAHKANLSAYNNVLEMRTKLLTEIEKVNAEIDVTPVPKLDPDEGQKIAKALQYVEEGIGDLQRSINVLESNNGMFEKTLKNLSGTTCPLSQKLVCSTDKTLVKSEIEEQISKNKSEQEAERSKLKALAEKRTELFSQRESFEEKRAMVGDANRLFATKKALTESLPPVPVKPVDPGVQFDEQAFNQLLEEKAVLLAAQTAEKNLGKLEQKVSVLSSILSSVLSEKGGVKTKFLEMALSPLQDHCNDRARAIAENIEVQFIVDGKGVVQLLAKTDPKKGFVLASALSSGEKAIVLFLLMDMLNALSGYRILLMDGLDTLDNSAFKRLVGCISKEEVIETYDHVFLAMVNHPNLVKTLDENPMINKICM